MPWPLLESGAAETAFLNCKSLASFLVTMCPTFGDKIKFSYDVRPDKKTTYCLESCLRWCKVTAETMYPNDPLRHAVLPQKTASEWRNPNFYNVN